MRKKAVRDSAMPSVSTWRTTGAKELGSVPPAAVSVSQYAWPRLALFVGRGGGRRDARQYDTCSRHELSVVCFYGTHTWCHSSVLVRDTH